QSRFRIVALEHDGVALDGIDDMLRRVQAFVRDGRIECREIDRPYRLRPEHERIVAHAFMIDLRFHRELAQAIEARFRSALDAAVEQMDGGEIARILQRPPPPQNAALTAL